MKVLVYTSPARGHLYPVVPIVQALLQRGHDVHLVTLSSEVEVLARIGIDASPIDHTVERLQIVDWQQRVPWRAALSVLGTFAERAVGEAPDLARAIERHDPDALLIDINCWGAATVAQAWGLPWAMYSPYLLPLPSRDAPPYGLGLRPLGGRLGAVRDASVRAALGRSIDRKALPALNALRARYGLPGLIRFSDALGQPALLLALTAEGFEYPRRDWPANVRLVGPLSWAPPQTAPDWLAAMPDPLVLVTCSTERQRDRDLVDTALKALPALGMSVIATTAAHDPHTFAAPRGSRVERFLPHEAILERAACVVCHGGMGITQKALAAGVPPVVVPFGRDQMETARRVEVAHAGVRLAPRRLTPGRLAAAVHTAIGRRAGARRIASIFAVAGGRAAAADAIEALARGDSGAGDTESHV